MKYLILIPDYTGSCIRDEFEGEIEIENLGLTQDTINELVKWQDIYSRIIPLSIEEKKVVLIKSKN
jgi:hypothetical protein